VRHSKAPTRYPVNVTTLLLSSNASQSEAPQKPKFTQETAPGRREMTNSAQILMNDGKILRSENPSRQKLAFGPGNRELHFIPSED
jgi:hypothetical protein